MAFSPQTRGYQRRLHQTVWRRATIGIALLAAGPIVIVVGAETRKAMPGAVSLGLVVLGVVVTLLGVLLPVRWAFNYIARVKKERALREPGTVQLLSAAKSKVLWGEDESWKLISDLEIRLDSGHTFTGSYHTIQPLENRSGARPFDAWFRVGASLRCLCNPANSDQVLVFPFAKKGDHATYNEIAVHGPDHVWFWSAT